MHTLGEAKQKLQEKGGKLASALDLAISQAAVHGAVEDHRRQMDALLHAQRTIAVQHAFMASMPSWASGTEEQLSRRIMAQLQQQQQSQNHELTTQKFAQRLVRGWGQFIRWQASHLHGMRMSGEHSAEPIVSFTMRLAEIATQQDAGKLQEAEDCHLMMVMAHLRRRRAAEPGWA